MDASSMYVEIDAAQLAMLLDGIDFGRVRRPKHWSPSQTDREKSSHGQTSSDVIEHG